MACCSLVTGSGGVTLPLDYTPNSKEEISVPAPPPPAEKGGMGSLTRSHNDTPRLSKRGAIHAASATPFWSVFDDMLRDVYCAMKNPNGIINMGIANNSLMEKELLEYFSTHFTLDPTDLTYGTSLYGSTRLFDALAKHYNSSTFSPFAPVQPEHILTGPGCGSLLDQLFEHIADAGETCLVAAPYYNGFDADLSIRSGVQCVPVHSDFDDGTGADNFMGDKALRGFETALRATKANVRAVIVCNPNNPVGRCYDRAALLAYGRFAQKHNLHLVFDEIYALSVFPTSDESTPQPFISALNIDWTREAGCDPARVHVLSSASKDFGLNGFRIGTFVSQFNRDLIAAMKITTKLYMVSSPADALFSALLNDDEYYAWFVKTNKERLTKAYERIKKWCMAHGIPFKHSNAGHFVLVDLSAYLPQADLTSSDAQREAVLWSKALHNRVCITPASNYHFPRPGWFRITFSLQDDVLSEGLKRLEQALDLSCAGEASPTQRALSPGSLGIFTALCGAGVQVSAKRPREEKEDDGGEVKKMAKLAAPSQEDSSQILKSVGCLC